MKKLKFLTLLLVGVSFFSLQSCSKDDDPQVAQDPRDQYVGTWSKVSTGSLTLFQNGQSVGTVPINENGPITISKSGSNSLIIDGKTYTVSGSNVTSPPTPVTENANGVVIIATENSNGTLGSNIILNNTATGTWNNSNGASGNLSGSYVTTLTR
jgi:hypothetical protein